MNWQRDIEVLTPLFNRGAYQDTPEIRVPSIRGMVRWWFRQLEYQNLSENEAQRRQQLAAIRDTEKSVFGGVHNGAKASQLVFRVSDVRARAAPAPGLPTLPHKQGGQASPQAAFQPGARFRLEVFSRFGPLDPQLQRKVENALEVWLLLGALGLRANRGGGNVWPADGTAPETPAKLRQRLNHCGCNWPVMLAGTEVGGDVDALRKAATDTVDGIPDVFGRARGGREASKVKFKIVRLENTFRLLITAPDEKIIQRARDALQGKLSKPEKWEKL